MGSDPNKLSPLDANQVIRSSYNDVNDTLSVDSFIVQKVGHKIEMTISTTNVANDTETYEYFDGATSLYEITVIYTSGTRETLLSVERTA
jgi:hypothetical protein